MRTNLNSKIFSTLVLLFITTTLTGQSIINQIGNSGSDSYRVRNGPTNANDLLIVRGSTGNLGLGILFPTEKFHLFGTGRQSFQIESSDNEASLILNGNHADGKWFIKNGLNSKDLKFHVYSAAHGNGPRMTIRADGNVGMGTTYPKVKLHVVGNNGQGMPTYLAGTMLAVQQNDIGNWAHLAVTAGTFGQAGINLGDQEDDDKAYLRYDNNGESLIIGSNGAERMRITSDGNVGIGTDYIGGKLHVYGTANYPHGGAPCAILSEVRNPGVGSQFGINSFIQRDTGDSHESYGVYSSADGELGDSYGVYSQAQGNPGSTNYGVYGIAHGGTNNYGVYGSTYNTDDWAGYFEGRGYFSSNVGIGTNTPTVALEVSSTDAILIPSGTTSEQPSSPVAGMIRFNSETSKFEGYDGSTWVNLH